MGCIHGCGFLAGSISFAAAPTNNKKMKIGMMEHPLHQLKRIQKKITEGEMSSEG